MPDAKYQTWCQNCIYQVHPVMLTGYCFSSRFDGYSMPCDRCGNHTDLAFVKVPDSEVGKRIGD